MFAKVLIKFNTMDTIQYVPSLYNSGIVVFGIDDDGMITYAPISDMDNVTTGFASRINEYLLLGEYLILAEPIYDFFEQLIADR